MPNKMYKTKNLRELQIKLKKIGREIKSSDSAIKKDVKMIIFDQATKTRNDILQSLRNTERNMGRFYSRQKGKKKHFPSVPGNPPAIDMGNMLRSILFDAYDYKFIIGSIQTKPPYPEWLEEPPPKANYEERPWLGPAVDRRRPIIIGELENIVPDAIDKVFRRNL